jgi:hypothetical protein
MTSITPINDILSRQTAGQPEPVEGMGVTILCWSDRHAGTITNVHHDGKLIWVREDDSRRADRNGMSESQEWEFTPNPKGRLWRFKKNKDGRWFEVQPNPKSGRMCVVKGGACLKLGVRQRYHDFSF